MLRQLPGTHTVCGHPHIFRVHEALAANVPYPHAGIDQRDWSKTTVRVERKEYPDPPTAGGRTSRI